PSAAVARHRHPRGALMEPRPVTTDDIAHWVNRDGHAIGPILIGGPEEGPDVTPCPAIIGTEHVGEHIVRVVHVPWQLDEIELAALAQGGTLWLTTWGGLPVHRLEVTARGGANRRPDGRRHRVRHAHARQPR